MFKSSDYCKASSYGLLYGEWLNWLDMLASLGLLVCWNTNWLASFTSLVRLAKFLGCWNDYTGIIGKAG